MVKMILMVAEKPSIAESLARAISPTQEFTKRTSNVSKTPVYEFEGTFPYVGGGREKVWIKVTSTVGHVYKTEFPEQFRKWDDVEKISELFDAPVEKLEADQRTRMPQHFQEEAAYCSHLVLWLDCDREGENICFEVMKNCCADPTDKWNEARLIPRNHVHRAIFSALDEKSLREAYWELRHTPNQNESDAVEARQEMDLKIGVAWTRYQTQHFANKFPGLDSKMLSYGPCQTPTLYFCVQRHDEITTFKPEKYYTLKLRVKLFSLFTKMKERLKMFDPSCSKESSKAFKKKFDLYNTTFKQNKDETLDLEWIKGNVFGEHICHSFKDMLFELSSGGPVNDGSMAQKESRSGPAPRDKPYIMKLEVTNSSNKQEERIRPQGLNTVTMLKNASQYLGIGPKEAMNKAEQLYLRGFITYPRTETTAYPRSFDHKSVLQGQAQSRQWGEHAKQMLESGHQKPRAGQDAGDHPPITPTQISAARAETIADQQTLRLYELICRNYLSSISTNLKYHVKKLTLSVSRFEEAVEAEYDEYIRAADGINTKSNKKLVKPTQPRIDFKVEDKFLIDPGYIKIQRKDYNDESYRREFCEKNSPLNICEDLNFGDMYKFEYNPGKDEKKYIDSGKKTILHDVVFDTQVGETKPPLPLTESELLGLMDKNGIGTDASMATHINTIVERHYVNIESGRRLVPTKLGVALVHGYQLVDSELVVPKIRQDMEASCNAVAKGEAKRSSVIKHALETFKAKYEFFEKNVQFMDSLFEQEFATAEDLAKKDADEGIERKQIEKDAGGKAGGGGKGEFSTGKGKGKSSKGGGKQDRPRKPREYNPDNDPDLNPEEKQLVREFMPIRNEASTVFIKVNTNKEKEIKKIEKKLRDIDNLEKKLEEGKTLDALQKKKMREKDELLEELESLQAS